MKSSVENEEDFELIFKRCPSPYDDYEVNKAGTKFRKNEEERTIVKRKGYLIVYPIVNGIKKYKGIHQMVAMTFVSGYQPGLMVRHLNDDRSNNRADNLAWGTQAENNADRYRNDKGCGSYTQHNKPIEVYDLFGNLIKTFESSKEAGTVFKISNASVSSCCRGEIKSIRGLVFKHKEQLILKDEIWLNYTLNGKQIKVSNMGRFIVHNNIKTFGSKNPDGYNRISCQKNSYLAHKIVGEAFNLLKPSDWNKNWVIDHNDGNKINNAISNLEWVSQSENVRRACGKPIKLTRISDGAEFVFNSIAEAVDQKFLKSRKSIYHNGKTVKNQINGFKIEFLSKGLDRNVIGNLPTDLGTMESK